MSSCTSKLIKREGGISSEMTIWSYLFRDESRSPLCLMSCTVFTLRNAFTLYSFILVLTNDDVLPLSLFIYLSFVRLAVCCDLISC